MEEGSVTILLACPQCHWKAHLDYCCDTPLPILESASSVIRHRLKERSRSRVSRARGFICNFRLLPRPIPSKLSLVLKHGPKYDHISPTPRVTSHTSHLDHCNGILVSPPASVLDFLVILQNAARLFFLLCKKEHMSVYVSFCPKTKWNKPKRSLVAIYYIKH